MLITGLTVFLSVLLILIKLPRRWMLRALKHDLVIDIVVTAVVFTIHFGTFSGVMAATVAGLLTSFATSALKRLFGHIDGDLYYPGVFHIRL